MTRRGVTDDLVHALVTSSHSEGIVNLSVATAVEHGGRVLLVASGGDELDTLFDLPSTAVLPGEHVLDALCRCLAVFGLTVAQFIGYLGHGDRYHADDYARVFCFAVSATDPNNICRSASVSHEWVDLDDSARFPPSARPHLIELSTWH
jgi:8-oxo-dGTP diphosphatase